MTNNEHIKPALLTGPVLASAAHPFNELWASLSDLQDRLAQHLLQHPMGTVMVNSGTGWALSEEEEGLHVVAGAVVDGVLQEPESRFDADLSWVDVSEQDLEEQIAVLGDAVAKLEAGHALPTAASIGSLAELRQAVQEADPQATFVESRGQQLGRTFIGPVTAEISLAFAQHLGRSSYAIHKFAAPAHQAGQIVEVGYGADQAPRIALSRAADLAR